MTNLNDRYYVMTYGTLMRGQGNHSWMTSSQGEFVERVKSVDERFTMISVHESFPAIVSGKSSFEGELYSVPGEGILFGLDYLEGYPTMYDRIVIPCRGLETGREYKALVYIFTTGAIHSIGNLIEPENSRLISFSNNCYKWL